VTKTGLDLRVARSMAKLSQGQLAINSKINARTIHGWERTDAKLPGWAVDTLSNFLEWPDRETIEGQTDGVYIIVLSGLTPHQFAQKRAALGKYVVQAGEINDV
jgi:hypothetical protein